MNTVRNLGVWLKRFRYRCGYGVHSPYAFNFITGVIFERGAYYAYEKLDSVYGKGIFWSVSHRRKCLHFLLRLSNFIRPDFFIADGGVSPAEKSYLSAGSRHSMWLTPGSKSLDAVSGKRVLVFVSACNLQLPELLKEIRQKADSSSALLLRTESCEMRERCSEIIQRCPDCGISFDLYDYLLVFFDENLYKQHYLVNFFD